MAFALVNEHQLAPNAPKRRISIIDGSCMGTHWVIGCALVGAEKLRYPLIIKGLPGRGHEEQGAKALIEQLPSLLRSDTPQLLLYDFLAFNAPIFHAVRERNMHILVKGSNPTFRDVLKDAKALFAHGDQTMFDTFTGFDSERLCNWKLEPTDDTFAGYPVRIAHLIESYPKRTDRPHEEAWSVTTDLSLSPEEIREAAHIRWSIENDCFKKLSTLAGTKRFHFKEQRSFLAMLRLFCLSVTAFELALSILEQNHKDYQRFRDGMKETVEQHFLFVSSCFWRTPFLAAKGAFGLSEYMIGFLFFSFPHSVEEKEGIPLVMEISKACFPLVSIPKKPCHLL